MDVPLYLLSFDSDMQQQSFRPSELMEHLHIPTSDVALHIGQSRGVSISSQGRIYKPLIKDRGSDAGEG